MPRYILTSQKTEGNITFGFNDEALLIFFEVNMPSLNEAQLGWFHDKLSVHVRNSVVFQAWAKNNGFTITEIQDDLSFDRFWHSYNKKRDKDDAVKLWNMLEDSEKALVFASLPAYKRYISRNSGWYNQLYAKTYLQKKHWQDEWDKL